MKTAMQEAIEYLKSFNLEASAIILEDKFLEIEKKQHETTFYRGINIGALNPDMDIEGRKEASKHYYECTFVHLNNQKKEPMNLNIELLDIFIEKRGRSWFSLLEINDDRSLLYVEWGKRVKINILFGLIKTK